MDRLLRARLLVAEAKALGLSVDDLVAVSASSPSRRSVPTVREYREQTEPTFSKGTRRAYHSYWLLAERFYGDKPLDTVTSDDVERVVFAAAERARAKRPGSDARSPRENCVAAQRALFERARRANHILENPAAEVTKPRRHPSARRGLDDQELGETIDALRSTSRDLELDRLLVEFHLVGGARQEGALRLKLDDLDDRRSTVWLLEKFGKLREQPVPPSVGGTSLQCSSSPRASRSPLVALSLRPHRETAGRPPAPRSRTDKNVDPKSKRCYDPPVCVMAARR